MGWKLFKHLSMATSQISHQEEGLWATGLKAQLECVAWQYHSSFLALFPSLGIAAYLESQFWGLIWRNDLLFYTEWIFWWLSAPIQFPEESDVHQSKGKKLNIAPWHMGKKTPDKQGCGNADLYSLNGHNLCPKRYTLNLTKNTLMVQAIISPKTDACQLLYFKLLTLPEIAINAN